MILDVLLTWSGCCGGKEYVLALPIIIPHLTIIQLIN
jgi:hypothetical protein